MRAWVEDSRICFRCRASGVGSRMQGLGFWVRDVGLRVSGLGYRINMYPP